MEIQFFDDPESGPRAREEVRFNQLGLYVYEDGRKVAVGFDITPFRERPSIEVRVTNERGQEAGSLSIIETLDSNFSLTMHLRDNEPSRLYRIEAALYYASMERDRMVVDKISRQFDATIPGDQ
jgi:hypothetical protein